MNKRDEAIEKAAIDICGSDEPCYTHKADARNAIAAYEAHMRPEVINLSELLDLPVGTILRDLDGVAWLKDADEEGSTWWTVTGSEDGFNARGVLRPARVIHWGAE